MRETSVLITVNLICLLYSWSIFVFLQWTIDKNAKYIQTCKVLTVSCGIVVWHQKPCLRNWRKSLIFMWKQLEWLLREHFGFAFTACAPVSDISALVCTNGVRPLGGLWVWRRKTNRRPCYPRMSNPSTSPWTARPDGSGWWDNWMAAEYWARDLVRPSSRVDFHNPEIIGSDNNWRRLQIPESLLIQEHKPELNANIPSMPLCIFNV